MNDKYLKSKQAIAEAANTSRNTVYKWMRSPDFPRETPDGWERVKVLEFAKVALAKAAKAQTGADADLKREKLRLQVKILETELQRKRGELAVESKGTVPRDAVVEEFLQIGLATWSAINNYVITEGNTTLRDSTKGYAGLCGLASELMDAIHKLVVNRLKESPIKLTADEIETAEMYLGFQW